MCKELYQVIEVLDEFADKGGRKYMSGVAGVYEGIARAKEDQARCGIPVDSERDIDFAKSRARLLRQAVGTNIVATTDSVLTRAKN